jgi:hypothetical protein
MAIQAVPQASVLRNRAHDEMLRTADAEESLVTPKVLRLYQSHIRLGGRAKMGSATRVKILDFLHAVPERIAALTRIPSALGNFRGFFTFTNSLR